MKNLRDFVGFPSSNRWSPGRVLFVLFPAWRVNCADFAIVHKSCRSAEYLTSSSTKTTGVQFFILAFDVTIQFICTVKKRLTLGADI